MSDSRPSRSDELHDLLTELGRCVQEAVTQSQDVTAALAKIRNSGYEPTFVIETRIATSDDARDDDETETERAMPVQKAETRAAAIEMTALDKKFLRSLKISAD